jgi:hypothetical protein
VFEDTPGCIVVSFHRGLAAQEGDITTYMNQHYRIDATVQAFKLVKDTTHWGLLADTGAGEGEWGVFYVYWPPWVPRPKVLPPHLCGPQPKWDPAVPLPPGLKSVRDPFGARSDAGVLRKFDTRVHEHSMVSKGPTLFGRM